MLYGWPEHLHCHRRRDNLIAGKCKTSAPTSGSSMSYGQPFRQHLHHHRRKGNLIAGTRKNLMSTQPLKPSRSHSPPFPHGPLFTHGPPSPHGPPWMSASKHTKDSAVIRPSDIPLWMTSQTSSTPHQISRPKNSSLPSMAPRGQSTNSYFQSWR